MDIKKRVKEYKKELLLQKVSYLFEKEGFENVKMADIAKYCNISVGALYKLFLSKEDLFYEYVKYQIDIFYDILLSRFKTLSSPEERLKAFISLMFKTFTQKKRILIDTIAGDPLFFAKLNIKKENPAKKVYSLLENEFENMENIKIKDGKKIAVLFKSFVYGYIEYWLLYQKDINEMVDEAYWLFMRGIEKGRE